MSFNFMAAVTIHSDFGAQENRNHHFILFYQWFSHFYCSVVLHCIEVAQFVYVLPVSTHLGGFQGLAITNKTAGMLEHLRVNLCVNIYFHLSWVN